MGRKPDVPREEEDQEGEDQEKDVVDEEPRFSVALEQADQFEEPGDQDRMGTFIGAQVLVMNAEKGEGAGSIAENGPRQHFAHSDEGRVVDVEGFTGKESQGKKRSEKVKPTGAGRGLRGSPGVGGLFFGNGGGVGIHDITQGPRQQRAWPRRLPASTRFAEPANLTDDAAFGGPDEARQVLDPGAVREFHVQALQGFNQPQLLLEEEAIS